MATLIAKATARASDGAMMLIAGVDSGAADLGIVFDVCCLHWMMDKVFRDDECQVRIEDASANFSTCPTIRSGPRRQGFATPQTYDRPLGRRMKSFSRFPWGTPSSQDALAGQTGQPCSYLC
jgi:hypothetical protein